MFKKLLERKNNTLEAELELKPGDKHYRAYVGPPANYDLVSAMVFNLLTCIGLRQNNKVLDIGCGSLRVGRLLIPFLNKGNYYGVEPNKWLVSEGVRNEIGRDILKIKAPTFSYDSSLRKFKKPLSFDFAIAQSIFSHTGRDLLENWLAEISFHLAESGALLATFFPDDADFEGSGWVYPGCVKFKRDTMAELAAESGLDFQILDWSHPRQTWALFSKQKFDKTLIEGGPITWNHALESFIKIQ